MEPFLTRRAFLIGAAALLAGAWLLQRTELVYGGPALAAGALPALPLLLLGILAALRGKLARGELLAIYLMTAIGLPLASIGWAHCILPGLVTGFYFFADEHGRYYPFLKLIPEWMVPGRTGSPAVSGFFEGGGDVPWGAWAGPLLGWSGLAIAFAAACLGLAGLVRQRWLEEERLRFPLAEVPLELLGRGGDFWRDRLAWAGLLVPFFIYGLNGLHHYLLFPGEIPLSFDLGEVLVEEPWNAMAPPTSRWVFSFSPLLIGLVYLLSVEVAFSTWFFFLLTRLQFLAAQAMGRSEDAGSFIGLGGQWREWPNTFPHLAAQARGGLLGAALLSLWAARHSLARACQRGLESPGEERWSLCLLAGGMLVLVLWGWAAGLSPWLSALHCLLLLLTTVGMMRLRLDGGLPVAGIYFLAGNLFYFAWGTGPGVFAPAEYVALAFLSSLSFSGIGAVALLQFEGMKMAEAVNVDRRLLVLAIGVGLVLGLVIGCGFMLDLVYERGLFALDQQGGARVAARVGRYFHYLYAEAGTQGAGADWDRLGAVGLGFGIAGALAWARQFFLRSPFHPLGFVYGTGLGGLIWGSALIGWAAKALVVRYGGAAGYRRARPFFLGMIAGELAMRLLWAGLSALGAPGGGYDW